jgi:hypothetical protein
LDRGNLVVAFLEKPVEQVLLASGYREFLFGDMEDLV